MPYAYHCQRVYPTSFVTIDPLEVSPSALRLLRLDFGSSAAAQSNQSWVKKGLRGVIIFEKKNTCFIHVYSVSGCISFTQKHETSPFDRAFL
jgi:hypothetical protein